eukprot:TRINITY_DN10905_c0_g1_i1.p1 TRINITY_DN10905_c0_g1~~TRINITY_DN10905_c0_g1_i1.p1  ORF type:complete len:195 (-),score=56.58 TRINITY_DN10905_c0_g1_i1:417-1001(-)
MDDHFVNEDESNWSEKQLRNEITRLREEIAATKHTNALAHIELNELKFELQQRELLSKSQEKDNFNNNEEKVLEEIKEQFLKLIAESLNSSKKSLLSDANTHLSQLVAFVEKLSNSNNEAMASLDQQSLLLMEKDKDFKGMKERYFISLALGAKLSQDLRGRKMNRDIAHLYDLAASANVRWCDFPVWINQKFQ